MFVPSDEALIVPFVLVKYILVPEFSQFVIVSSLGKLYLLFKPTEMIPYLAFTFLIKSMLDDVLEPW